MLGRLSATVFLGSWSLAAAAGGCMTPGGRPTLPPPEYEESPPVVAPATLDAGPTGAPGTTS
jgi:hypothetical protein